MVKKQYTTFLLVIMLSPFFYISGCQPATPDISPTPASTSPTLISSTASPTKQSTPTVFPTATPTILPARHADLMIFIAHPDDETICCATVIQQALAAGKSVHIVIFTNGDGWDITAARVAEKNIEDLSVEDYIELARVRQNETLGAIATLGLSSSDITFLGYPDGGLEKIYNDNSQSPYTHEVSMRNSTYGPIISDYHSTTYGSPAMYLRQNVLNDVADLVQEWEPDVIYIHSEADPHMDHKAVFWFVRDVYRSLGDRHYVFTFCNTCMLDHKECIEGLPCHAPNRISPTADQARTKYDSLKIYQSQIWVYFKTSQDLQGYSELDEPFWPVRF